MATSATASDPIIISIDAGTTGVRSFAIDARGVPLGFTYREFTQHFPHPGWVEHDAAEIWTSVVATLDELTARLQRPVAAIGITNQRETIVVWDRITGKPLHRAIVWQDRRTADRCDKLRDSGALDIVRKTTGLVLDPYFSGTKLAWIFGEGGVTATPDTLAGTIDSWLVWNLTGGFAPESRNRAVHVTDPSNASRTMLYDITAARWSAEMCELLGAPIHVLPTVVASSGRMGVTADVHGVGPGIPISGIAGDQQAALFGQACFTPGAVKNTYGTGSFILMNAGTTCPPLKDGLLTTVAWQLAGEPLTYAYEGAVFVTGAAIQWLRDGLGIINSAAETGPLAASVPDTNGAYFVPALVGLGTPWWDPHARGTILGITRGTTRAHIARAAVEAMAYQTRDVVDLMTESAGLPVQKMRVDGGASVMDALCQFQADQLGAPVARPVTQETTALGAAYLAGLAEGVWASTAELAEHWQLDAEFTPDLSVDARRDSQAKYAMWKRAVTRSLAWD